jgi:hypothetical protein
MLWLSYVTGAVSSSLFFSSCAILQWRTLTKIIGGAKRDYIVVEGANLIFFAFYMVKNDKY